VSRIPSWRADRERQDNNTAHGRIEAMALAFGAKHVTTVEYNSLTFEHPAISTVHPRDLAQLEGRFDTALSISRCELSRLVIKVNGLGVWCLGSLLDAPLHSFDHDGLGRYGDPLCPDGDLLAMDQVVVVGAV